MARIKKVNGFTVSEVMVSLCILIIAVGIAIPSFISWRRHNQFTAQVRRFKNVLTLGRSAAIYDNDTVEICPSIRHRGCDCQGDWSHDILVREMHGHVLSVMAHPSQLQIDYRGNLGHNDRLVFNSLGATLGQQGSFRLQEGSQKARVVINSAGRIREAK